MKFLYANEMTWEQLDNIDRDRLICVLPIGSMEQHGKHLPLGTDDLILEHSLRNLSHMESSIECTVLIYPHIKYGNSVEHMRFPGTVSLKVETLIAVIKDVVESMVASGIKNVILLNSHGGNTSILQSMSQELRFENDIHVFNIDYWASNFFSFAEDVIDAELKEECHAGEIETSLLLHWRPDLVKMDNATHEELNEIADVCQYDFSWLSSDLSISGVIGNAIESTEEKGLILAQKMGEELKGAIEQIALLVI